MYRSLRLPLESLDLTVEHKNCIVSITQLFAQIFAEAFVTLFFAHRTCRADHCRRTVKYHRRDTPEQRADRHRAEDRTFNILACQRSPKLSNQLNQLQQLETEVWTYLNETALVVVYRVNPIVAAVLPETASIWVWFPVRADRPPAAATELFQEAAGRPRPFISGCRPLVGAQHRPGDFLDCLKRRIQFLAGVGRLIQLKIKAGGKPPCPPECFVCSSFSGFRSSAMPLRHRAARPLIIPRTPARRYVNHITSSGADGMLRPSRHQRRRRSSRSLRA